MLVEELFSALFVTIQYMSNFVVAITGPTGAGKSTVGEGVAKRLGQCVTIDADHLKHMIVGGFYVDASSPEDPKGWGFREWDLVGESIGLLAQNFKKHGYDVVINGYIDEEGWQSLHQHVTIDYKIMLLPSVETIVQRDAGRIADVQMGEVTARKHHEHFSSDPFFRDFTRLDTTNENVATTVEKVIKIIHAPTT